tara:strand:+ start:761 stop:1441 length:681 start_codon:yes stop_codon:yes gene_type:complete
MTSPKHVAIIMDGNGRWGINKKKSRNYGHKKGVLNVEKIINASIKNKINFLTLYTFSTENWKRPKSEIKFLLKLLERYIDKELLNFKKKGVRIRIIGNINKFPISLKKKLKSTELITKANKIIQINVALNYGGRHEIIYSIKKIHKKKISINEKNVSKNLYTSDIPDPEILIRTGNRKRLSNFLLWQSIYTEIFFEKKLWPDFNERDFNRILLTYKKINRNFGGLL